MSSRVEELLAAAVDGSGTDGLDPPQSRNEKLLFALNNKLSEEIANLPTGGTHVSDLKSILTNIVTFLKAVPFDDTVASASDLDAIQTQINALSGSSSTGEPISILYDGTTATISGLASVNVAYSGTTATIGG